MMILIIIFYVFVISFHISMKSVTYFTFNTFSISPFLSIILILLLSFVRLNCFSRMVDQWKVFSLISRQDHRQRSSWSWFSNRLHAGFEPAQNLSSSLVEWNCAIVITTTSGVNHYTSTPLRNYTTPLHKHPYTTVPPLLVLLILVQ